MIRCGHAAPRPPGAARGQASVELVLLLPFVVLLALFVVQVVVVGRSVVLVGEAARDGARAAAVDPDPAAVASAVRSTPGLDPARLRWTVGTRSPGRPVRVTVRYHLRTAVPLVGGLVPDPWLTARMSMLAEQDPGP